MVDPDDIQDPRPVEPDRFIMIWLVSICLMILAMIVLGGITRLTRSGLSIVNWSPILGILPPLSRSDWAVAFQQYRLYPEYRLLNPEMTLTGFKSIYFWEYAHRLLGRLITLALVGPGLLFFLRGRIRPALASRLGTGLLLIGAQGALGWYMVRSGLVDRPWVSHYRLAAHLGLGLASLGYFVWLVLDLRFPGHASKAARAANASPARLVSTALKAFLLLLFMQALYGALTAGLKAGFVYNTFPKMNGQWIPSGIWPGALGWSSLIDNSATVQFIHRTIGWSLLFSVIALVLLLGRTPMTVRQRIGLCLLVAAISVQFALGVTTLLMHAPLLVASLHQLGACVSLVVALHLNHAFSRDSRNVQTSTPLRAPVSQLISTSRVD